MRSKKTSLELQQAVRSKLATFPGRPHRRGHAEAVRHTQIKRSRRDDSDAECFCHVPTLGRGGAGGAYVLTHQAGCVQIDVSDSPQEAPCANRSEDDLKAPFSLKLLVLPSSLHIVL